MHLKLYDVSEPGSASVIRYKNRKDPIQLGPLDRASLDHWVSKGPYLYLAIFIRDDGRRSSFRNVV
jgi:hypothetical protein